MGKKAKKAAAARASRTKQGAPPVESKTRIAQCDKLQEQQCSAEVLSSMATGKRKGSMQINVTRSFHPMQRDVPQEKLQEQHYVDRQNTRLLYGEGEFYNFCVLFGIQKDSRKQQFVHPERHGEEHRYSRNVVYRAMAKAITEVHSKHMLVAHAEMTHAEMCTQMRQATIRILRHSRVAAKTKAKKKQRMCH